MEKELQQKDQKIYLKGYRDGFEAAQKIIWAYAEQVLISADNPAKPFIQDLIDKIKQ